MTFVHQFSTRRRSPSLYPGAPATTLDERVQVFHLDTLHVSALRYLWAAMMTVGCYDVLAFLASASLSASLPSTSGDAPTFGVKRKSQSFESFLMHFSAIHASLLFLHVSQRTQQSAGSLHFGLSGGLHGPVCWVLVSLLSLLVSICELQNFSDSVGSRGGPRQEVASSSAANVMRCWMKSWS